jgi:deazaflavin-dependent oxidoreductase (nitroreductase family)
MSFSPRPGCTLTCILQLTTAKGTNSTMDPRIEDGLNGRSFIDITTTGRQTGEPRRIEIAIHRFDGRYFISGSPSRRKRAWIANLEADPHMTVHIKANATPADLPATARVIDDEAERRAIMPRVAANWRRTDVDVMVAYSPLIEVTLEPEERVGAETAESAAQAG